ncbi:pyridoxal-dependent decarboxylase [Kordiimonas sediminis]|uniref:Pyridoxal-dependent decarboxylase n=1 Tax=Kordiimonas sediminis TaxID=1735581 RepID=A0A919AQ92_9PROT|nr:pyridoxal-dependent decarboxylase [Kordiimonas sediminis]GHF19513.1 pyridoxal-dependent decarboxylase [Kordiimonas sediminis]
MDSSDFRKNAHALVDWIADYMDTVRAYPVRSQVNPGDIRKQLAPLPPQDGEDFETIFDDFKSIIMPGITHWQHPRFFAYFPANGTPPSQLAEMLLSALGVNAMIWETSPAATELEEQMINWLLTALKLPSDWSGVIQDTASTAVFCAVLVARERVTGWQVNDKGFTGDDRLTVYTTGETHSSLEKAVKMAGLGRASLRFVPTGDDHSMDVLALSEMIKKDKAAGFKPALIVASVGATGIGACDALKEIGIIARSQDIYFHVDAAWAGSAMICDEYRPLLNGAELADSFCFNPHKWLGVNFDCSVHFVKDKDSLIRTLTILPEYLKTREGDAVTDYRDWGPQLGRRNRALKLWFVLRSYGLDGLRKMIRGHVRMAEDLAKTIGAAPDFEIVTRPRLSLFTFRVYRPGVAHGALDAATEALITAVNDDGFTYLTRTVVDGRPVIRWQVGQVHTTEQDVSESWDRVQTLVKPLLATL